MKNPNAFEVDQKYQLTIVSDEIELPPFTRGILEGLMTIQYYRDFPTARDKFKMHQFILEIEWRWLTNRGSLPKRIGKWYYDTYNKKLPESLASSIGNIVRKHTIPNKDYHFDFTRKFTWNSGDFGDGGSCFWGDRSEIRQRMMADPRFYAMRFFTERQVEPNGVCSTSREIFYKNDKNYYNGMSRAWLVKDEVKVEVNKKELTAPIHIIFNGYGMTTEQIASVFASYMGEAMKAIPLTNYAKVTGGLYVNDTGYLIGDKSVIDKVGAYDFGVAMNYDGTLNDEPHENNDEMRRLIISRRKTNTEILEKFKGHFAFVNPNEELYLDGMGMLKLAVESKVN